MSKLIKLYYITLTNARCIFLFVIIFSFSLLLDAQNITNNKIRTIVIDPGHGGKDPGTMGTKRYSKYEKDIALSVSLKLGDYISNSFPDVNVVYTRNKDVFLKLNERTEIANNLKADLFISVHCDGFTNSKPSGASVFVMGMSKLKANLDIAMRENSVIYLEDNYQQRYDGFEPESAESYIVFNLMQNTYLAQSLQLAEYVEQEFSIRANRKSRGVKQAPFYVISRTNMPSILVECGFLTNPQEEDFLQSEQGQDYISSAIFRAFRSYKTNLENMDGDLQSMDSDLENMDSDLENKRLSKDSKKGTTENKVKLVNEHNIIFKVQIGTYLKSMMDKKSFVEIEAQEVFKNNIYKYYVGAESQKSNADQIKNQMLDLGFNGAFVVAFYKDARISMKEALALQTKIDNYE